MLWSMCGLQEHEIRVYCLLKNVNFSLLALSDFFCRHAYAYAHMRIIRHETDMAAYAWPSLDEIPTAVATALSIIGAQICRQNIRQITMKGGGGGAQIPTVVAKAFYNEIHQNTLKIS